VSDPDDAFLSMRSIPLRWLRWQYEPLSNLLIVAAISVHEIQPTSSSTSTQGWRLDRDRFSKCARPLFIVVYMFAALFIFSFD